MNPLLSQLADNPALFEAVKATILEKFEMEVNEADAPVQFLGEALKARLTGMKMVNEAFAEIARLKSSKPQESSANPAR